MAPLEKNDYGSTHCSISLANGKKAVAHIVYSDHSDRVHHNVCGHDGLIRKETLSLVLADETTKANAVL